MSLFESGARKTSRTFTAKFNGECASCDSVIYAGDEVMFDDNKLVHAECDELPEPPKAQPPCGKCFLVHAGDCF